MGREPVAFGRRSAQQQSAVARASRKPTPHRRPRHASESSWRALRCKPARSVAPRRTSCPTPPSFFPSWVWCPEACFALARKVGASLLATLPRRKQARSHKLACLGRRCPESRGALFKPDPAEGRGPDENKKTAERCVSRSRNSGKSSSMTEAAVSAVPAPVPTVPVSAVPAPAQTDTDGHRRPEIPDGVVGRHVGRIIIGGRR